LQNWVRIFLQGAYRYIQSNGIPDHATGTFPNPNCPNTMTAQNYNFKVPANPQAAATTTDVGMNLFGVGLNGVPFDPAAAEWWNRNPNSGWQYEPLSSNVNLGLDSNNAHVQPDGSYHYHGLPTGLLNNLHANGSMTLIGWAADGFPIYGPYCYKNANNPASGVTTMHSSYRLKNGTRPSGSSGPGGTYDGTFVQDYQYVAGSGDLDECNGRTGVTPDYPSGTYYYVLSVDWPVIPRKLRGTGDASFLHGPGGATPTMPPPPSTTPTPRPTQQPGPRPTPQGTRPPHPRPTPSGTPPQGGIPPQGGPPPHGGPGGLPSPGIEPIHGGLTTQGTPPPPGGRPGPCPGGTPPPGGHPPGCGGPMSTPTPLPTSSGYRYRIAS
jgi:hypothetical protein